MSGIITAVLLVVVISLIVGVVLAAASVLMEVPTDEKTEKIEESLPGANCGACGYSGCAGYAAALSNGEAQLGLCSLGGQEAIDAIALIIGTQAVKSVPKTAVVHCGGNDSNTAKMAEYQGVRSCACANQLFAGLGKCLYGCIGYGDCVHVCEYGAISINDGVAQVNVEKCRACGKCVNVCPKKLIAIEPKRSHAVVKCINCDKGAQTKKSCAVGCIGCMKCANECSLGAIRIEKFHAVIDAEKCTGCEKCVSVCPQHVIEMSR